MSDPGYRIIDEPRATTASHLVVDPFWVFLGGLLGGMWLAWPWYAFNGLAMGSATRRRELVLVVGSLLGALVLALAVVLLHRTGNLAGPHVKYVVVALQGYKLVFLYFLHRTQARSYELFEHFGGARRTGLWGVALGFMARSTVIGAFESDLWVLVMA